MIPAGYMAKKVLRRPEWLKSPQVVDVYSVSSCVSDNFGDYINNWRHNGYWLFDSPAIIREIAQENSISLEGTSLFYYEVHDKEFDEGIWSPWVPEPSFATYVVSPSKKQFEGLTSSLSMSEPIRNALRFHATRCQTSFARILIACSRLSRKPRVVSAPVPSRMLNPAPTEFFLSP